jgi:exodeoxyribonuclease-1
MAHLRQLQTASGVVEKIQDAISQGGFEQHDDPDLMLYQGEFFSASDKQVMTELRNSAPVDLMRFTQSFQDNRLPEMLTRYRARNFPSELDKVEQESWNDYRRSVWQGDTARRRVLDRISALKSEGRGEAALDDLEQYVLAVTDWL